MHYAKFLGKKDELVLPYLGGELVEGAGRRLRVDPPRPAVGWTLFEVRGRSARALGAAERPDLGRLASVRGHHVAGFVVESGGGGLALGRVRLLDEEAPPLAVVRARRWHSGALVFDGLDFDTEVEEALRLGLEKGEPVGATKGVPASARMAYGIALVLRSSRGLAIPVSVREAAVAALRVAELGEAEAATWLAGRAGDRLRVMPNPLDNAHRRAEVALDAAHARLLSSRHLQDNRLEVAFEFMGERLICVVDAITLHVYDSGVCLAGADELLTLDSLPGVIREAIEREVLVITRR